MERIGCRKGERQSRRSETGEVSLKKRTEEKRREEKRRWKQIIEASDSSQGKI